MYRGIIGLVEGTPDGEIESTRERTAVEAERIDTFGGEGTLVTGQAVGSVERERDVPYVEEAYIHTERETEDERVCVEFLANLSDGWVTVDSSDGEFFWEYIEVAHGVNVGRAVVDVDGFAEDLHEWENASVWQSQQTWDDPDDEEAGGVTIAYHDDAGWPEEGVGQLGFEAVWDGMVVRGVVAASGYVALFNRGEEFAGRFLSETLVPYCSVPDEEQVTLNG